MNKKLKTALMLFISVFSALIGFTNVNAATLVQTPIDNVYYTRRGGGQEYMSAQYKTYDMDNTTVYCIEPGVDITTHLYNGAVGWVNSPYSSEVNRKIQLIGYYGYEYPGHHTLRYRMAAQALIWETTGGQIVEFWTEASGWGDYINIDYEKNEIMKLVNTHYQVPSFNNEYKTGVIGKDITFTDTTGVLSNYQIYNSNGATSSINGNTLTVVPNKVGEITVSLVRKSYTNNPTTIFVGIDERSQKMAYFGLDDPVVASVKMNVLGGRIEIVKTDVDTGTTTPSGEASLIGAVYGVYDLNDNLITTLTTDNNSYAISDYLPDLNVYYLKEISAPTGYTLDEEKYYFRVDSDNLLVRVELTDKVIERDFEITKVIASDKTMIMTPEVNVEFGIYDINNNQILKLKSDNDGKIYFTLPYGNYILRQLSAPSGYEKIDDYSFSITENGPTINKVFSNAEITSRIKVVKVDDSGNVITKAGIKFKIKDVSTGKYICQTVAYPNNTTYCEFETDSNGMLITPYPLNSGVYELEEVDQFIDGYLWNSEPLRFTIDENSNIVSSDGFDAVLEIRFENKEVKGAIEIKKTGEKLVIDNGTYTYEEIPLPNVKFEVYDESGNLVGTLITNELGFAKLENLKLQKYTLKEISSSLDNLIDGTIYEVDLIYKDQYTPVIVESLSIKNYLAKGTLEFSKVDFSTSDPIPNTKIEIYTEDDELIGSYITDDKGMVVIKDLPIINGKKYYILEKEAPISYVLNEEKLWFEITTNGEIIKSTMTNRKITSTLQITKVDEDNNKIAGVKFGIYDLEDNLISEHITDDNGYIEVELEYGKYYFKELATLNHFVITDEKIYFEVVEDKAIIENTITNKVITGTLEFTKVDFSTSDPIPNTLIEIYNAETDEIIFSGRTDEFGKVVIENLEYGKYYILEKECVGYILNEEKMYFEILENGEVVKATMENQKIEMPKTFNTELTSTIIIISTALLGIGLLIYEKKKNK